MKIQKLKFKNLNSLENEHIIDFQKAPLVNAGVFAITGPNGSGKSTILDAITLALYGETFRFHRPAEYVMTRMSSECYAEIEFAVGENAYRARWAAEREGGKATGEVMPPEMTLTVLNASEEVTIAPPSQVCAKIADIIGMDFRSFTRSALLAQGDFAAFLNALDSERLDILEKVIGLDIYGDYRNRILADVGHAEQILIQLKQDLADIRLLEPVKREAFEHDLIDFQEQYAELAQKRGILKEEQSAFARVDALRNLISDQQNTVAMLTHQLQAEQTKLDRLADSRPATALTDDLKALEVNADALRQHRAALDLFRQEAQQIAGSLAAAGLTPPAGPMDEGRFNEQMQLITRTRAQVNELNANRQASLQLSQLLKSQIKEKQALLESAKTWLEEHASDRGLVEHFPELDQLKRLREQSVALKAQQAQLSQEAEKNVTAEKKNRSALGKQRQQADELTASVARAEEDLEQLAQGRTSEEIKELVADQEARLQSVRELLKLGGAYMKLNDGGWLSFFKSTKPRLANPDDLASEIQLSKIELTREENIAHALEEAVFSQELRQRMAAERLHLADGKPCPLCGSKQHPYAHQSPSLDNSRQALIDQQSKIKKLKTHIDTTERALEQAKKQAELDHEADTQCRQLQGQWSILCNRLNLAMQDVAIDKPYTMKRLLKQELLDLKQLKSLAKQYSKQQQKIEKLKALLAKAKMNVEQLEADSRQLSQTEQNRLSEKADNDQLAAQILQQEAELAMAIQTQLAELNETLPSLGQENEVQLRLTQRLQAYRQTTDRHQIAKEDLVKLVEKEKLCQAELIAYDKQVTSFSQQLHADEGIGLQLALVEKQKLIADGEQRLRSLENEAGNLQAQLTEKMQDLPFKTVSDITNALTLMAEEPALMQRIADLEQEIRTKSEEIMALQAQLETDPAVNTAFPAVDEMRREGRSLDEKIAIANQEVQRLEKLLKDQDHLQQEYDRVLAKMLEQEKIVEGFLAEKALLAPEQSLNFRRKVQNEWAEKLLSAANALLEKISGRYYVRQIPSQQGLALEIEDTLQKNTRRVPKTLSGGETFIVSLALALALSELISNGKAIDSLFLDEGFGNLDAENLYTVISTLERLQTHGKTVGVISHVESVQKRIKVQLQVVKKPNGMGMLKKAS